MFCAVSFDLVWQMKKVLLLLQTTPGFAASAFKRSYMVLYISLLYKNRQKGGSKVDILAGNNLAPTSQTTDAGKYCQIGCSGNIQFK